MPFSEARFLTSATTPEGYPRHRRVEVASAGRSNVGKSSLINTLTAKGLARVSASGLGAPKPSTFSRLTTLYA